MDLFTAIVHCGCCCCVMGYITGHIRGCCFKYLLLLLLELLLPKLLLTYGLRHGLLHLGHDICPGMLYAYHLLYSLLFALMYPIRPTEEGDMVSSNYFGFPPVPIWIVTPTWWPLSRLGICIHCCCGRYHIQGSSKKRFNCCN